MDSMDLSHRGYSVHFHCFTKNFPVYILDTVKLAEEGPAKKGAIDGTFQPLLFVDEEEPH